MNDGPYGIHTFQFSNESLEFTMYGDYVYNKVEKDLIYFKTKNVNSILKSHFNKTFTQQFLFMYTFIGTYNNLLGFYYESVSLEDIRNYNLKESGVDLGNGIMYNYNFGKFAVVDIFRKTDKGVIRFVNINNPKEIDPDRKKFHREVNGLFFKLNQNLWDNPPMIK
ncbi:hypothetical protein [Chryseobacterium sp. JUb7]|uniref:hypothetical protein n=1 Tax=Chryseobacterium sp. JUb7 TaxID=2940599 RepID=UPI0021688382|nr:hypothetical protein [Chryseobacterium sp. JUb7]MCS3533128.1 hypothetical protein [Chryseobacterium sp. JUb7]